MRAIEKHTLKQRVRDRIFDAILRGELLPGQRLVESQLAGVLGVAKTTLREALQDLEHQGMLTKHGQRGTFVTKLSEKQIEEAYAVRYQLEPFAASLAHRRMTPGYFGQLCEALDRTREAGARRDFVEVSKRDAHFHRLIWRQSGNSLLVKALELVCFPLWAFELITLYRAPTYDLPTMLEEHRVLLDVLKAGGPEEVRKSFERMLELFREQDIRNLQALKPVEAPSQVEESSPAVSWPFADH